MASKRQRQKRNYESSDFQSVDLSENEKLQLSRTVHEFISSGETELELHGLTTEERKFLHIYAEQKGLQTVSTGGKNNRVICITQKCKIFSRSGVKALKLAPEVERMLYEVAPHIKDSRASERQAKEQEQQQAQQQPTRLRGIALLWGLGQRMVPPRPGRISAEMSADKMELPIYQYKDEICDLLRQHQIFIVNGETGSGKTTQIPQYILEEANQRNRPCRILVTQPRRVAAVSVAQRVAEERGENLGDAVGYQIRMESRVSKSTNLIYTTSGCLLRSIMSDTRDLFNKITHLIIDEIHERDKHTDFTLITVQEELKRNKDLRIILMSATMDIETLSQYFDNCPVMNVPGRSYEVKLYYLEDILYYTGYRTLLMDKYLRILAESENGAQPAQQPEPNCAPVFISDDNVRAVCDYNLDKCCDISKSVENLTGYFDTLLYLIEYDGVPVDVGQSKTGMTALMGACKMNLPKYVQALLRLNANVHIRDVYNMAAADYAAEHPDGACSQLLHNAQNASQLRHQDKADVEKQRLLSAYQQQFMEDSEVDHDLILSLLEGLYRNPHPGAIMVFLPGYNDIVLQRDLITSTLIAGTYKICILHGQMDSQDQTQALKKMPGIKKIILSTNIGQTSITIPDLAYIIDSGKVKMKNFDATTESSQLETMWISQADASQRSGRAGRTQNGICYRLYSKFKYEAMPYFALPEFMRIPLTEICLYAKTLDGDTDVHTYLRRALTPPSPLSISSAVRKLQILNVFDSDENVTELGKHLVEMPLDVQLGKCLLYSIFLKCVDPMLTIVAFHSIKDPFILPSDRTQQGHASFQRKSFAGESFSDQRGVLGLYNAYMSVRQNRKKQSDFCHKYFLSQSAMEMFCATRRQLADLAVQKFRLGANATLFNNDWNMIRFCLVAGFYPNVAYLDREKGTLSGEGEKQLILQRTSSLNPPGKKNLKEFAHTLPHEWIIYYEKSRLQRICTINMNTVVPAVMIALQSGYDCYIQREKNDGDGECSDWSADEADEWNAAGKSSVEQQQQQQQKQAQYTMISLDSWIKFGMLSQEAEPLLQLRQYLNEQFNEFLKHGHNKQTSTAAIYVQKLLSHLPSDNGELEVQHSNKHFNNYASKHAASRHSNA